MGDLWEYRDLLFILALRDVKVRYKQTALGVIWVILQPLANGLIFAIIFGMLANLPSDGHPYLLFVLAGMIPWNLFSHSLQRAGVSLTVDARLVSRAYFPRMVMPIASTLAVVVDFCVAMAVLFGLMVYYGVPFGWTLLLTPVLVGITLVAAIGVSLWESALNVQYRDFMHMLPFLVQAWMFASPVVYSTSLIPEQWRWLYALNPMVGLIEGFRWSLLGLGTFSLATLVPAVVMAFLFFISGAAFFRRLERKFADVI